MCRILTPQYSSEYIEKKNPPKGGFFDIKKRPRSTRLSGLGLVLLPRLVVGLFALGSGELVHWDRVGVGVAPCAPADWLIQIVACALQPLNTQKTQTVSADELADFLD